MDAPLGIVTDIQGVRAALAVLDPDDTETIIPVGLALESLVQNLPAELQPHEDLFVLALETLQALYEGSIPEPGAVTGAILDLLSAAESLCKRPVPELVERLRAAGHGLRVALGRDDAPDSLTSAPLTLDDLAAQLIVIDHTDQDAVLAFRDSLDAASGGAPDHLVRRLLVEASVLVSGALTADDDEVAVALEQAGHMIEEALLAVEDAHVAKSSNDAPLADEVAAEDEIEAGRSEPPIAPAKAEGREIACSEPIAAAEIADQPEFDPLPADSDMSLLAEFVTECRELVTSAEAALLTIEADPSDSEAINTVFRAFHTVKGTSGFLGLDRMTKLAHRAENLLSRMRDGEILCTGAYADLALRSTDMLKAFIDGVQVALETREIRLPDGLAALVGELENPPSPGAANAAESAGAGTVADTPEAAIVDSLGSGVTAPPAETDATPGVAPQPDVTAAVKAVASAVAQPKQRAPDRVEETTVRVRMDRLDKLIEMVGELVIAQAMVAQDGSVLNGRNYELSKKVSHTGKIVRELQDLSMSMRMVPLKATFQKMARLVRDLAHATGKSVQFAAKGDDTEIDRNMVDIINDPLVHLIRNAMDHGIEPPDDRESSGKPRSGSVSLAAYHSGENVVVEITDDGKGLDRDRIARKAVEKGLIESDKGISDQDIYELIFAPGFSTAERVTEVSGRGVGMDVVKKNVDAIRGKIEITSHPGKGSTFRLRLPLTLAITDGMLVQIADERYIVPTINIQLCFRPEREALSTVQGRGELVLLRGELMPIFRLHVLFGIPGAVEDPCQGLLIVVGSGQRRCAVMVDELLGQQQVVAKALGSGMKRVPGISGGAILGDGRVGLIIDTNEIVQLARQTASGGDLTYAARAA